MDKSEEIANNPSHWAASIVIEAEKVIALERIATALEKLGSVIDFDVTSPQGGGRNFVWTKITDGPNT